MSGALGTFGSLDNQLARYLNQMAQPVQETPQQTNNTSVYEVRSKDDLDYVDVPKGSKQIVFCETENKVYVGRHNFITGKPDWKIYVEDEEIKSVQTTDNGDLKTLAEALLQMAKSIDTSNGKLDSVIDYIKKSPTRGADGKFRKAGE